MDLEEPSFEFKPGQDKRPRVDEPLPVRLVAVADCRQPAPAGIEAQLDSFYVDLLGFQRDAEQPGIVYRADNFRLYFDVTDEPINREDMRPLGIEILSLAEAEHKLLQREIDYRRVRGISPGHESLALLDPAGNWVELIEFKRIG